ncbi:3,4-dihydroxy-2-butanone 4-phosphate synthase [Methylocella silvestris BL2]|uniref:3,4-dihydroxy-2-butanone 4-phosphate synthase n=1 Tax=Methylocella silvestris (strain DSM 15510 / CIP 108128 / LMG 27833 / NCIMB 13906 / BL2) TaxID=395965 RepID=B8ESC5_METSB|nr:3,4-dihydroxy-2-butanone-4-phosphate synthase [Methylocella silvestris]ACK49815.1 3,4-dihydroxy-2-butanone 4-phosphate synthase [Methylocella silvestris BL2]
MKLGDWLKQQNVSKAEFARRTGLSKGAISQFCNSGEAWVSRETAQQILRETQGAVTPNDFLAIRQVKEVMAMGQSVSAAIEAIARGELVIVTDDGDRENEGDLVCAASLCTPEKMAFIIRHCCGIVCAPLTASEAKRLNLAPMVATNDAPLGTAFTVSVDVRHGLTTGISAEQRSNTVRALANGNMGAADFVRPGHVFPLVAREGGVLMRSGHTEAAVDLVRLAGLPPVGVICELANDDGTVMAGPQIAAFASAHQLKQISVADLIAYRQAREKLVERVGSFHVEGPSGPLTGYAYRTPFDQVQHFAFVQGEIGDGRDMPTRLHRVDIIADVITGGDSIKKTFACFKKLGRGVFVYLRDGAAGVPAIIAGDAAVDSESLRTNAWREVGLGAQILRDLGVSSIRLRTSRPMTYVGLSGFGVEIVSSEGLE